MKAQMKRWLIPLNVQRAIGHSGIILCLVIVLTVSAKGVAQESDDAAASFRAAAEQGVAEAQFNLGSAYFRGEGVPQDYAEAAQWYRAAAEQGHAKAQYSIGVMYGEGLGVVQDYVESASWYRLAGEQGLARAQHNLGYMYGNGLGLPQDDTQAAKWYGKAVDQGFMEAQTNLAVMYANGQGVPQDLTIALLLLRQAADQGDDLARTHLDDLHAQRTTFPPDGTEADDEIVPSQELAQRYLAVSYDLPSIEAASVNPNVTVIQLSDQGNTIINQSNAQEHLDAIGAQLTIYSKEIEKRGFHQVGGTYATHTTRKCKKVLPFKGTTSVDQDGFKLQLMMGRVQHRGVVVESKVAVEHGMNPEITFLGEVGDGTIKLKHRASKCVVTLEKEGS